MKSAAVPRPSTAVDLAEPKRITRRCIQLSGRIKDEA
jgi:hypothetical protein